MIGKHQATVIPMSIQRMVCTGCGAEANASCNCGVSYVPKAQRAAEAVKANPEKSDRAIAKEIGASPTTVGKAREQLSTTGQLEDTPRTGLDGKTRAQPTKAPKNNEEAALRSRAVALGRHLSRRGNEYRLLDSDGSGSGGLPHLEAVADQLDAIEGKVGFEITMACPLANNAVAAYKAKQAAINAKDIGLESFDAHVLELIRLTKGQKPQRVAKTAVAQPLLGDLAHFLRELVTVRKLTAEAAS
jgi:hypothetical protein